MAGDYLQSLMGAVEKSLNWGCFDPAECPMEMADNITVERLLSAIKRFIQMHEGGPAIRTRCHHVHFQLWDYLSKLGLPSMVTIGDIRWQGREQPIFKTSYSDLKREWRGVKIGSTEDTNYHVWLTLGLGGVIVDLTVLPHFDGEIPPDYPWIERVFVSGHVNAEEQIEYIPYLVGAQFLLKSGAVIVPGKNVLPALLQRIRNTVRKK